MGTALAPPRKGGGSPPARAEKARKAATVCPPTVHRWLMTLKLDMSVAAFSGFLLEAYGIKLSASPLACGSRQTYLPTYLPARRGRRPKKPTYLPTYLCFSRPT